MEKSDIEDKNNNDPFDYNCEVLLEKTTLSKVKNPSYPNDAYLIWYVVNETEYLDLVRGKRVNIFDMYYDRYGKNSVKKIDFGYGRLNPKLFGYKKSSKKKRK